ncbi:hypothetical protein [Pararhodobacter zhoushanensis]|uniref:Uncharacterized protein n=1 Tax=Pararhodobacter zhoushanensis TaxID=2479545 RepID=A0ABT3H2Z3_9RHOB|nr:hypothetical protein [Pararhodobacter zhoushanensis]MCW1934128.1 hypothetical protein [Pararhodobacter zhoushanensis]
MGIRTTNLDQSALVDELLGNYNGSTVRVSLLWLLAALTALQGPSYATFAELEGDLDWPNGSQGYVTGDETPGHDGRYRKDGAAGTGTWTRIGDLPSGGPNQDVFNDVAAKVDLLTVTGDVDLDALAAKLGLLTVTSTIDLDTLAAEVASLNAALVLKGGWDASSGTFPGDGTAQAGFIYLVTDAGTVDGQAFAVSDRLVAIVNNASTGTYAGNWLREAYTNQVQSVAGRTGEVTLTTDDISGLATLLATRLAAASNLSDLPSASTARNNLGLGNVNNTADVNKPVSFAQQAALDLKATVAQMLLTIKQIGGVELLPRGSGCACRARTERS